MDVNPRTFTALAATDIGVDNRQWIEVMPTATDAKNGPWRFTITRADLEAYAASIQAGAGKIPVDYDHDGAREGGSTKAAGWFTGQARVEDTADRGPILLAQVQWTPSGADSVRNGEFKMISPEFSFHDKEPKTGLLTRAKEILAATLTNRPFFRQLAPVAADLDTAVAALAEASGVSAEALHEFLSNTGGRAAPDEQGAEMPNTLKALAATLGLPEDATDEQITAAVTAKNKAADELTAVKAELEQLKAKAATAGDDDRIKKLEDELAAERKARVDDRKEGMLARAVTERRIDPAIKAVLAEQFGDNLDGLEKVLATYTPKPAGAHGGGGAGKEDGANAETEHLASAFEYGDEENGRRVSAGDGEIDTHAKALKILADRGKHTHTPDEYLAAYAEAERAAPVA